MSRRPKRAATSADDAFDLGVIEDVEPPSVRGAAGGRDFLDDARDARLIDIGDRDQRAFLREQMSGRAAHPAGSAGDEHAAPLHRAIEFLHWLHFNSPLNTGSIVELSHSMLVGVVKRVIVTTNGEI